MPYNEDEVRGETNSLHSISFTEELNMGASRGADEAVETPRSESARAEEIRIDREDRALSSAVFHDSLAIRTGLIVIVGIALLGLAWIVSSSLGSSHLPSSPSVQIADCRPLFLAPREIVFSRWETTFMQALGSPALRSRRRIFSLQRAAPPSRRLRPVH